MRDSGQHQHRNGAPDSKKNELKPWLKECWCIPPEGSAEFVCAMEDVLEIYYRQYRESEVLVCLHVKRENIQPSMTAAPVQQAR